MGKNLEFIYTLHWINNKEVETGECLIQTRWPAVTNFWGMKLHLCTLDPGKKYPEYLATDISYWLSAKVCVVGKSLNFWGGLWYTKWGCWRYLRSPIFFYNPLFKIYSISKPNFRLKNYSKIVQRVPSYFYATSPMLISYITTVKLVKIEN